MTSNTENSTADDSAVVRAQAAVLDIERRKWDALINKDFATLDVLFADDLVHIHARGTVDSKASYMAMQRSDFVQYERIEFEETEVRVYHLTTAVVTGRFNIWQTVAGLYRNATPMFTAVWVRTHPDSDDWKLTTFIAFIPP